MTRRGETPKWCSSLKSGGTNCVEVAIAEVAVLVRDSKDPDGPHLIFAREQWADFIESIKAGYIGA
jgi:hypothetical protein